MRDTPSGWRRLHPQRFQLEMFSRANPFMRSLEPWLALTKNNRQPISNDNALWQAQTQFSDWMKTSLDAYRDLRDHLIEAHFHAVYGSPSCKRLSG